MEAAARSEEIKAKAANPADFIVPLSQRREASAIRSLEALARLPDMLSVGAGTFLLLCCGLVIFLLLCWFSCSFEHVLLLFCNHLCILTNTLGCL